MAVQWQVKTLINLATESVFKKIISQFIQPSIASNEGESSSNVTLDSSTENTDDEHEEINPPPLKKRKVFISSLETSSSNDRMQTLRAQLDEYLVSSYSQVRQTLLNMFLSTYCYGSKATANSNDNLFLYFFNAVLDNNCKSCSLPGTVIGIPINGVISNTGLIISKCPVPLLNPTKLLEIISIRCPLLERLDLSFSLPKKTDLLDSMFCFQLGKLTHLTSLKLSFEPTDDCLDFFTSLGYSCPQLVILHLFKLPFGTDQLLAMMLGSKHALLPPDFSKDAFQLINIQFDLGSVRPICNSLKELYYVCGKEVLHIAFVLRHFRNLEKLERSQCKHSAMFNHPLKNTAAWAVQHWHQKRNVVLQEKEIVTASNYKLDVIIRIQWKIDPRFTGLINLVALQNVQINSWKMMEAITSFCLSLKEIQFCHIPRNTSDILSVVQLQNFLTSKKHCLSKVYHVSFRAVPSDFRQTALSVIGHQLQVLKFTNSQSVDIFAELFPFPQLKELIISSGCTLSPFPAELSLAVDNFLPNLMKLTIFICLGRWSRVFECHRPSLVSVRFACPHFNIPSRSRLKWNDLSNVWPNLRHLAFNRAFNNTEGLELEILYQFIPQLKQLQLLTLPYDSPGSRERSQLFVEFVTQMRNQTSTGLAIAYQTSIALADVDH